MAVEEFEELFWLCGEKNGGDESGKRKFLCIIIHPDWNNDYISFKRVG
jgi:hypothetical protein